jgi:hypothetical protein
MYEGFLQRMVERVRPLCNGVDDDDYQMCISHSDAELRQIDAGNSAMSDEDFDRLLKDDSDVRDMLTYNKKFTKTQKAKLKAAE